MKLLIVAFTILAWGKPTESAFSYSDVCARKDLCFFLGTNIACEANSIKLCAGGQIIDFTPLEISNIVSVHNKLRDDLATAKVLGFNSAVRMGTMTWDDELAAMADLNVRRCTYGRDCHNTPNYPASGQNIAYVKGAPHETFNRTAVVKEFDVMINDWFSGHADLDIIGNLNNIVNTVTSFSAMSIDKNDRDGCAGVWYPEDGTGRVNFVCNYGRISILGLPIYINGAVASKCKTGTNPKYPGLCSVNEEY